jgi:Ser/Thr protein kinase RdoA (MazF antagonist)
MNENFYKEALHAYTGNSENYSVQPLDGGLINHSYKITNKKSNESFLFQRINHHVFKKPENVQLNYQLLWKHIKSAGVDFYIPEPKYFPGDADLYWDSTRNYWRVIEFIEDGKMLSNAETAEQARETAQTFAEFTAAFHDFNVIDLKDTIPDFHNLSFRYKQFEDSLEKNNTDRKEKAKELIEALQQRKQYVDFYNSMEGSVNYPKRVMHHDAKIANILFSKTTGKVICPVDFDTTMPGYFFSDLGDMIRSMACSQDESSIDFENITIRKDFYDAIVDGYLSVMNKYLTEAEKKNIHYAGIIIIYMQALRFMTDYLDGDVYYKTTYPEQNFDRAKNQLALLKALEQIT